MLFQLFDREQLALVPALQFSAPLPQLEAILRPGGDEAVGIEWGSMTKRTWLENHAPRRGLAPYYNPLDERVQQAMLAVVRELSDRYRDHAAFRGLAIQLAADGYAQLPGSQWGFDDRTIERFQRETRIRVPGAGPERFAQCEISVGRKPPGLVAVAGRRDGRFLSPHTRNAPRGPAWGDVVPGWQRHVR